MKKQSISQSRRGIALIIVLAMLVLLSGLLVAFMTSANIERNASFANSGAVAARQIGDSTVSLVIGQIRDATTTTDDTTTWASQPGAIRTFGGTLTNTRKQVRDGAYYQTFNSGGDMVYKLYSSDELRSRVSGDQTEPFKDDLTVIDSWDRTNPTAEYVDINEPVLSPRRDDSGKITGYEPHYPIIDPRALYQADGSKNTGPLPGMVDGFDAKIDPDEKIKLPNGAELPFLPMPVKWLYVLKDGTMQTEAQLKRSPGILKGNPVVGRTAFWADDESCKININTSSEGTFWDTPTASGVQESGMLVDSRGNSSVQTAPNTPITSLNLSVSQPSRFEYQHYPGHPAQTCLSPVLGALWGVPWNASPYPLAKGSGSTMPNRDFKEAIYQLSPFIPRGNYTSQGGTRKVDPDEVDQFGSRDIRSKHLYATVDEILFKSNRFSGENPEVFDKLTPDVIDRTRFFLTANSRAPETNLYGRPRVSIWPVSANPEIRTTFDDLFAFASTVYKGTGKEKKFSILRDDAKSATNDYSGGSVGTQNSDMYRYLQALTSRPVPGFGGTFSTKYTTAERDEILTQIFDYVRAVNLVDTGTESRTGNIFLPYTPRFFPEGTKETDPSTGNYVKPPRSFDWSGQVVPLRVSDSSAGNDYQGQGRFITMTEAALIFSYTKYTGAGAVGPNNNGMQAVLALEMATTTPGFVGLRPTYFTKVIATSPTTVKFPADAAGKDINLCKQQMINICNISPHEVTQGRAYIPIMGFTHSMHYFDEHKSPTDPTKFTDPTKDPKRNNSNTTKIKTFSNTKPESVGYIRGKTVQVYPYVSDVLNVGNNSTFSLHAGGFQIEIWSGEAPDDPRATLVQTINIDFQKPAVNDLTLPVPITYNDSNNKPIDLNFQSRFDGSLEGRGDPFSFRPAGVTEAVKDCDVVRSVELVCNSSTNSNPATVHGLKGDIRLAAALAKIPPAGAKIEDYYLPRDYAGPTAAATAFYGSNRLVHGLVQQHSNPMRGHTGTGVLVSGQGKRDDKPSILPKVTQGVLRSDQKPGDWDRGLSKQLSGAFVNKVDEGNVGFSYGDGNLNGRMPYFRGRAIEETGQTMFTPNRQLSSPVMFGSIPTGVVRRLPWQTLLFRPNRESGTGHPGSQNPPDHLLLDLFEMPVVEPYAISEPMSTAGKVNLNYKIAPFGYVREAGQANGTLSPRSYIRRDTALRAVLKSVWTMAVPTGQADGGHTEQPLNNSVNFRFPIQLNRTIEEMETRLQDPGGSLFRSPSEICTVDLYPIPNGGTPASPSPVSNWETYWNQNALTGDNMRERPYSLIYSRVTTKSNIYTVHMRCQALKKAPSSDPAIFDPKKDQVIGEYRGSATIERFIDSNDPDLARYDQMTQRLDPYYRYRVIATKHFAPH